MIGGTQFLRVALTEILGAIRSHLWRYVIRSGCGSPGVGPESAKGPTNMVGPSGSASP